MRPAKSLLIIFGVVAALLCGCSAAKEFRGYAAPSALPHIRRDMKTAGFWVGRHPAPDRVFLAEPEIKALNRDIAERLHSVLDLVRWPAALPGDGLKQTLRESVSEFKAKNYYSKDGRKAPPAFFDALKRNINADGLPSVIQRQYGLVVRYADQRLLPTDDGLYAKAFDVDFDELQNSALDTGTPVVIQHRSLDEKWFYVQSALSAGWTSIEKVALTEDNDFLNFYSDPSFIVVTEPKADLYLDEEMTAYHDYLRMGVRLPLVGITGRAYIVSVASRADDGTARWSRGYIGLSQAHQGYLSYTPRHVLQQAFKLLNAPYGWGGMYGEQDCSRFVQEVFATVGVTLPRNSRDQIAVGNVSVLAGDTGQEGDKREAIRMYAFPGASLLGLAGHIMIYAGEFDGRLYAIHSVWAYRQPAQKQDDIYIINRVALSDLSLGEGSRKGSLFERILSLNTIGLVYGQ